MSGGASRPGAYRASVALRIRALAVVASAPPSVGDLRVRARSASARLGGPERILPVSVAGLVLVASILSVAPATGTDGAAGGTGNTDGPGDAPRVALIDPRFGEVSSELQVAPAEADVAGGYVEAPPADASGGTLDLSDASGGGPSLADGTLPAGLRAEAAEAAAEASVAPAGPYLADGTLLKPVAVDTSVADGSAKLREYKVRPGDTLTGIAARYGVSMMTLWWANELSSKDALHVGQTLVIPPVSGLVVTVRSGDTLDSLAASTGASADEIVTYNGLADRNLILGQTLVIPGAKGEAIPTPRPRPQTASSSGAGGGGSSGGSGGGSSGGGGGRTGGSINPPSHYSGGAFAWPVPGGYISQYFHYGHYGLDIAAPYGDRVLAAAAGTVIYAGWKNNGGGYQVWLSHGSNLYTTYNHMSAVSVGVGQHVARGQQVGRIGMTGWATGPHCHFEVWQGPVWDGGSRVNPLGYL
jgi:murein DD-endopeptidase MepM/ murein hydrolase activator NlpD